MAVARTRERSQTLPALSPGGRLLIWRLLTLAWAVHITWMSTESFGGEHTRSFLARLLVGLAPETLEALNLVVRKSAHLVEYAILGTLLYQASGGAERFRCRRGLPFVCLLIVIPFALVDEFHQSFVPGRGPSLMDSCLDVAGAAMAILLLRFLALRTEKPVSSPPR